MSDFNNKTVGRLGDLNARLKRLELFEDKTLLSDLSGVQLENWGWAYFDDDSHWVYSCGDPGRPTFIRYHPHWGTVTMEVDSDCVLVDVTTLGQLLHLIAALGGEVK